MSEMADVIRHEQRVRLFLEHLGKAYTDGNLHAFSSYWEIPALILSDHGDRSISDRDELEKYFAHAVQLYRTRGLAFSEPDLQRVEQLSSRLVELDVRWPAFNEEQVEQVGERWHFILRFEEDGDPLIRVAVMMTA
jgi:hypothetical protein